MKKEDNSQPNTSPCSLHLQDVPLTKKQRRLAKERKRSQHNWNLTIAAKERRKALVGVGEITKTTASGALRSVWFTKKDSTDAR